MGEKRRASTRVKGEPAAKKRTPTPAKDKDTPISEPTPVDTPAVEEPLPTKITDGKPLPTLDEPQPADLPNKEYQSIKSSGVLAASIQRSAAKWVSEGIFEKCYVKKPKKKGAPELYVSLNTRDMHKEGVCRLCIEPHIFEATMYTVKVSYTDATSFGQSLQPLHRPILQYGPPHSAFAPPPAPPQPAYQEQQGNFRPYAPPSGVQMPLHPQRPPQQQFMNTPPAPSPATPHQQPSPIPPQNPQPPPVQPVAANGTGSAPVAAQQTPKPEPTKPANPPSTTTTKQSSKSKPDPVIQMLAQRAATDVELKNLMQIVADGNASEAQLRVFQKHIDELNVIIAARNAAQEKKEKEEKEEAERIEREKKAKEEQEKAAAQNQVVVKPDPGTTPTTPLTAGHAAPPPVPTTNGTTHHPSVPPYINGTTPAPHVQHYPSPHPSSLQATNPHQPYNPGAHQPVPQKHTKNATPNQHWTAVAMEFTAGNGDRFLFPRYSILEYMPGRRACIASFIIVRRGSNIPPEEVPALNKPATNGNGATPVQTRIKERYDPTLDYYQPVTVRLQAENPRILEHLARVVAPVEEVKRWMEEVMDGMTRAEYVHLAMRLPKGDAAEESGEEGDGSGAASGNATAAAA